MDIIVAGLTLGGLLLPGGSKMSKGGAELARGTGVRGEETRRKGRKKRVAGSEGNARKGDRRVERGRGQVGPEACIHPYPSRGGYWDFDYLF